MKNKIYAIVLSLVVLMFTSCGGGSSEQNSKSGNNNGSKGTIGISVLTLGNPFFNVIAEGVKEEAAKHGYDVRPLKPGYKELIAAGFKKAAK